MKRRPELVPLSHHHHHGLVAAERVKAMIRDGLNREEAHRLYEQVVAFHDTDLEPHFQAEERWLLPYMKPVRPHLVERTLAEHQALRGFVRSESADPAKALQRWAEKLVEHIRFEEQTLFERAQTLLTEAQFAEIGAELAKLSREPHLPGKPKV